MSELVESLAFLIQWCSELAEVLGPGWTVVLILGLVVTGVVYKLRATSRMERGYQAALDEKERTIQRLSEECRGWRVYFGMDELGMGKQKAEKVFQRNEFATPQEARQELEKAPRRRRRRGRKR